MRRRIITILIAIFLSIIVFSPQFWEDKYEEYEKLNALVLLRQEERFRNRYEQVFTVFIPQFTQIFLDMGKEQSLLTPIPMTISWIVSLLWSIWLILVCGIVWFTLQVKRGRRGKIWWYRRVIRLSLFDHLIVTAEVIRFMRLLSIPIGNQLRLLKSVQNALKVIPNSAIAISLDHVIEAAIPGPSIRNNAVNYS